VKIRPLATGPVVIGARFNGPENSGNGGYTCGAVAAHTPWEVPEVTLRIPPPLETELTLSEVDDLVRVTAPDGTLVAEAREGTVEPPVAPVSYAEAVEASKGFAGFRDHPFPTCFVCGPGRPAHDGLEIFPGRLGDARTAAPFRVPADVSPTLLWAALDCPGGWAVPQEGRPYVLGRCAVRVDALPEPGDECVVMGELTGEDGRKAFARTTLYAPSGRAIAISHSVWIAL
jgi:hypothetical protein